MIFKVKYVGSHGSVKTKIYQSKEAFLKQKEKREFWMKYREGEDRVICYYHDSATDTWIEFDEKDLV